MTYVYVIIGVGEDEGDYSVLGVFTNQEQIEAWLTGITKKWEKVIYKEYPNSTFYDTDIGCFVVEKFTLDEINEEKFKASP